MNAEWMILLRATTVLSVCALVVVALRHYGASVRHAIWSAGISTVLVLPLMELAVPKVGVPILRNDEVVLPEDVQAFIEGLPPIPPAANDAAAPIDVGTTLPADWPLAWWLWIFWGTGAAIMLTRLALGSWFLRRLVAESASPTGESWDGFLAELRDRFGIRSGVSLRMSPDETPPMTRGLRRHLVLLPASAAEWEPDKQRLVLAHELAHIRRRDGLTQAVIQVALVLYWFHPLVWYGAHRARIERERAADAEVLALGPDTTAYAQHLLATVGELQMGLAFTTVSIARPNELAGRLSAILNPTPNNGNGRWVTRAAFGVVGALTIAAALITLTRQPPFMVPQAVDITGRVATFDGGNTVPGAVLRLGPGRPTEFWESALETVPQLRQWLDGLSYEVQANANGQVVFENVTPGTHYLATADAEGFLPNVSPRVATIAADGSLSREAFLLTQEAAISGRVLDAAGTGVPGVLVNLLEITYDGSQLPGVQGSTLQRNVLTNDLGEYRIRAAPGSYLVAARTVRQTQRTPPMALPSIISMPLYNPGVYSPDDAAIVTLEAGDAVTVDVAYPAAEYHQIMLRIGVDESIGPIEIQSRIRPLTQEVPAPPAAGQLQPIGEGLYASPWLTAGTYEIALWGSPAGRPVTEFGTNVRRLSIAVDDEDVMAEAMLEPPTNLPVRITGFPENFAPDDERDFWIALTPSFPALPNGRGAETAHGPRSNGDFEAVGVSPGHYRIFTWNLPSGLYIERARYAGQDLGFWEFDVMDTSDVLELEFSENAGTITGTARNAMGDVVPLAIVVVMELDEGSNRPLHFFGRLQADPGGRFELDLGPGSYLLYSADVYQNPYPTREWLFERQDQLVTATVQAGQETIVDVPLLGR